MSGYRQSSYDPAADERMGRPLRPFNWVQWLGIALIGLGVILAGIVLAADLGVIVRPFKSAPPFAFPLIGMLLVNSRRQPAPDLAPELAPARRRWLLIVSLICIILLAAAAAINLIGAN